MKHKNMTDKEMIDSLLNDKDFQAMVEKSIGRVFKVTVDWPNNTINIFGEREARQLYIDVTLAVGRGQMQ